MGVAYVLLLHAPQPGYRPLSLCITALTTVLTWGPSPLFLRDSSCGEGGALHLLSLEVTPLVTTAALVPQRTSTQGTRLCPYHRKG